MVAIKEYFLEIILVLVAVLLLLILFVPYGYGYRVKTDLENIIESVSEKSGYHIEAIEYKRNWFDTNVTLLVKDKDFNEVYRIAQRIIHGPLYLGLLLEKKNPVCAMVVYGNLFQSGNQANMIYQQNNPVQFESVIRFDSNAEVKLDFPDVTKQINIGQLSISGMHANLNYLNMTQKLEGVIESDKVELHNGNSYELKGMRLNINQDLTRSKFTGDVVLSLLGARAIINDEQFNLSQITSRIVSDQNAGNLNYSLGLNIGKFNLMNEQMTSISATMKLTNVSGIAASSIYQQIMDEDKSDTEFAKSLPILLNASVFELSPFSFYTESGQFSSDIKVSLKGQQQGNTDLSDQLDISANVSVSAGLFVRMVNIMRERYGLIKLKPENLTKRLIRTGFFDTVTDKYQLQLEQKNGRILINNRLKQPGEIQNLFSEIFVTSSGSVN